MLRLLSIISCIIIVIIIIIIFVGIIRRTNGARTPTRVVLPSPILEAPEIYTSGDIYIYMLYIYICM